MTRRRASRRVVVGIALAWSSGAALAGCNLILGIDEEGPKVVPEEAGEIATPDAGVDARPTFERCTVDSDCLAPNGCYTPHCDRALGACTYALCESKGTTCSAGTCDTTKLSCDSPTTYGFRTSTYGVAGVTSGCGPTPDACVAAMYPFLFLGTNDTVVALRVDDLLAKSAAKVTLSGAEVKPNQLVQSGRRLWVIGAPVGAAPPYRLPLAVIDVPSDPTVSAIEAKTSFLSYPFPNATGFAAPNGALFLTYNDPAQGLPTAVVDAPVVDNGITTVASAPDAGIDAAPYDAGPGAVAYTMYRAPNVPPGGAAVASSGTRLVTLRGGAVTIVDRPGTASAVSSGDLGINPGFGPQLAPAVTQGPDGVVALSAPVVQNSAAPDCDCITLVRTQWLLPNAIATALDQNVYVNPEGYRNPPTNPTMCNSCGYFISPSLATWIDSRSLLVAAAASNDRERTAVRLLARDPFSSPATRRILTRTTDVPKGNFATDRVALTSSNGFGYLVLSDSQGNGTTVSIFDPRCDVPDGGN